MMRFTRERKKYRIENPYDEKLKLENLQKQNEQVEEKIKNKQESHNKNNETQVNKAEQFMKIYKKYMEQNQDFEKVQKENEYIKETKDKTVRRKKIKKLNIKLKKNNLIEKLIKNKAFMVAKKRILIGSKEKTKKNNTNSHNKTPSAFNENSKKIQKLITKSNSNIKTSNTQPSNNNKSNNNKSNNSKSNNKNKQSRIEIVNKYDQIVNSNNFLQNPLEFAKNALEQKKKPSTPPKKP
ncbi:conserved Plasmodium protein, unknown function [Plasmodium chabaudi adami]|uniref:Uncharacterized protein n=1 Tax=Plasmodium chabaudi adami TaxID=5826 RepID=A0A1D3RTN6_PLACE|nr:conserved Plasmodium protein, unknown function [Plasmodium chabaudi adami]